MAPQVLIGMTGICREVWMYAGSYEKLRRLLSILPNLDLVCIQHPSILCLLPANWRCEKAISWHIEYHEFLKVRCLYWKNKICKILLVTLELLPLQKVKNILGDVLKLLVELEFPPWKEIFWFCLWYGVYLNLHFCWMLWLKFHSRLDTSCACRYLYTNISTSKIYSYVPLCMHELFLYSKVKGWLLSQLNKAAANFWWCSALGCRKMYLTEVQIVFILPLFLSFCKWCKWQLWDHWDVNKQITNTG